MSTPSGACCGPDSEPRVRGSHIEGEGRWMELDGMKTYVTGSTSAKRAVVFMYDIFGFIPQSIHASDLLAFSSDGDMLVIMPDWFEGEPARLEWVPPKTEQQQQQIDTFFKTTASIEKSRLRLQKLVPTLQATHPGVEKWAIIGFCWGGKLAALASQAGTPFSVSAQSSPAFLDHRDAEKIVIPTALMASNGEPAEEVQKYTDSLSVSYYTEYFTGLEHGWMTSRASLNDPISRAVFEDSYQKLRTFLVKHM